MARTFLGSRVLTAAVCALAFLARGTSLASAQTIAVNTKRIGFLPLPGPDLVKGLWTYEADGRRYCLQTRGIAGLAVIDMTDPTTPALVANVPGKYRKVQVFRNYAYLTDDGGPTVIVDIADPTAPVLLGASSMSGHTLRVDTGTGRLYLNRNGVMDIFSLKEDPTKPKYLGSWAAGAHDSRPQGDTLYAHGFQWVPTRILDVSDPTRIRELGGLDYGNHSGDLFVAPDGRKVLLALNEGSGGHVELYDVTSPSEPVRMAGYSTSPYASVHNVEVKGAYAYIAYYQDQLRILDLSDPFAPEEVGVWDNNPNNRGGLFSDAWEAIPFHDAVYMNQMDDTAGGPRGTHAIDFFPAFGESAPGAGGKEPETWWSFGPPSPGNRRFALRLTEAPSNTRFWLLLGRSRTAWGSQTLPLAMERIGAPNLKLQVSPEVRIQGTTDAQGRASVPLPVSAGAGYQIWYAQIVVRDPGAPNGAGLSSTRPGKLIVW